MTFKIFVRGNYFYIVDTTNELEYSAPSKDVEVSKSLTTSTSYKFKNIDGISPSREFEFSNIQDQDGNAYTDQSAFDSFYERNTVAKGNVKGHTSFEKFGKNINIATSSTPEDVWNGGGDYTGFPTGAAETMEIFSSSDDDTDGGSGARTVRIYNLLDENGAQLPDVEVTLNGQTPVSLGATLYYRGGTRIKVLTAGVDGRNVGTLTLRHTTTTANIFAVMPIGMNQTAIAAYTVPLGKTLYCKVNMQMSRDNGLAGSASVSFRNREHGTVFNTSVGPEISDSKSYEGKDFKKFVERTDIKVRVDSVSDNNTIVSADFYGELVDN